MEVLNAALQAALGSPVTELARLSGGDINVAFRAEFADGERCFVKINHGVGEDVFDAEADGLREIARCGALAVPKPLAQGSEGELCFLALEWLELTRPDGIGATAFGRALARMHAETTTRYGWHRDNTLGATPQPNAWMDDWVGFWRERRLGPQLALAESKGYGGEIADASGRLMDALDELLEGYRPEPSLLHGDLWGGNWSVTREGMPAVYDPAVYYGDAESDLAMMQLFGGFPPQVFDAYRELRPAPEDPAFARRLRDLYQLHHLLNHANLFGGGYLAQSVAVMERLVGW